MKALRAARLGHHDVTVFELDLADLSHAKRLPVAIFHHYHQRTTRVFRRHLRQACQRPTPAAVSLTEPIVRFCSYFLPGHYGTDCTEKPSSLIHTGFRPRWFPESTKPMIRHGIAHWPVLPGASGQSGQSGSAEEGSRQRPESTGPEKPRPRPTESQSAGPEQ